MAENEPTPDRSDSQLGDTARNRDGDTGSGSPKAELTISLLTLAQAIPTAEMPEFLQQRVGDDPSTVSLTELGTLDVDARTELLQTLDRALSYYQREARKHRVYDNAAQRAADQIEAFLKAAKE